MFKDVLRMTLKFENRNSPDKRKNNVTKITFALCFFIVIHTQLSYTCSWCGLICTRMIVIENVK